MQYMVTKFVPALRKIFGATNLEMGRTEKREPEFDATLLVGFQGRLFTVWCNYSVTELRLGYSAHGSGEEYALGALHALCESKMKPKKIVERALMASAEFAKGVRGPFTIEQL
jgi:ATP-dependent protease HslVU (ClpYQ) peptidase subunit